MTRFAPTSDVPTLYLIAGSPTSWRVWLSLELLGIEHRVEKLSFSAGDTRQPEYLALNPRGQVPVLVDGDLVLSESFAILEHLDEQHGDRSGRSVWPIERRARARARRIAHAADGNLGARVYRPLADQLFLTVEEARDGVAIERAVAAGRLELAWIERELDGWPFAAGAEPCAADFTIYGLLAFLAHIERHHPQAVSLIAERGSGTRAWMRRVEALPYFARTWPEHWPPVGAA